jgi:hypothetical protein
MAGMVAFTGGSQTLELLLSQMKLAHMKLLLGV